MEFEAAKNGQDKFSVELLILHKVLILREIVNSNFIDILPQNGISFFTINSKEVRIYLFNLRLRKVSLNNLLFWYEILRDLI